MVLLLLLVVMVVMVVGGSSAATAEVQYPMVSIKDNFIFHCAARNQLINNVYMQALIHISWFPIIIR